MPTLGELMRQRLVEQQQARQGIGPSTQMAQEWLAQQMAAAGQGTEAPPYRETQTELINLELAAQATLKVDPEVDRIASHFFNYLMDRINQEFRYDNPKWEQLGAREKQHWLAATEDLLDELRKEPVTNNELSKFAHRRIIAQ